MFCFAVDLIIPPIKNKQSITVVLEKGHWTKYIKQKLAPQFTELTQVPVNIVEVKLGKMHDLQSESLLNANSDFDVLTLEAGWAKEWAAKGYTIPLNYLANEYSYDQSKWTNYIESFYPSLLEILTYQNQLYSIPYNTYVMGNHYRLDLFNNEIEKKAFQLKYNYKLTVPKTLSELKDTAEFFTRKKGELLKGKKLTKDFYGVALMSGDKPHINDEWSAILWAMGGVWFKPNYENGKLLNFTLPKDLKILENTASYYLNLKKFSHPTDENFAYMESAQALSFGNVAMWPFAYNNLWSISSKLNSSDEEQKFAIANTPGARPYHGAYAFAVAYDSNNPEAAFWFLRFMTSIKSQTQYAAGGGNPTRIDVNLQLSSKLEKNSPQFYSLKATFDGNREWNQNISKYGHYVSTAMGTIYPLLTHYTYLISNESLEPKEGIKQLMKELRQTQNKNGEKAMIGQ